MQVDSKGSLNRHAWRRWTIRFGLPSMVVALSSVWLYEPESLEMGLVAAGVAVAALLVFVLTMPRRAADGARRPCLSSADNVE